MSYPHARLAPNERKEMKSLKVTTVDQWGEHDMLHSIGTVITEDAYIVAILKGVTNAGSIIKSFEVVEV